MVLVEVALVRSKETSREKHSSQYRFYGSLEAAKDKGNLNVPFQLTGGLDS